MSSRAATASGTSWTLQPCLTRFSGKKVQQGRPGRWCLAKLGWKATCLPPSASSTEPVHCRELSPEVCCLPGDGLAPWLLRKAPGGGQGISRRGDWGDPLSPHDGGPQGRAWADLTLCRAQDGSAQQGEAPPGPGVQCPPEGREEAGLSGGGHAAAAGEGLPRPLRRTPRLPGRASLRPLGTVAVLLQLRPVIRTFTSSELNCGCLEGN